MWSALKGIPEITQLLLEDGCEKNTTNDAGFTALHLAAQNGHINVTRCLVELGIMNPWVKTPQGDTPYNLAVSGLENGPEYKEVVEYLQMKP
ncbi:Hypothetical predicted protein [Mytilus galloprovincialis]|uniref:Uncharacterized protein n=1 Tax=Mytilus galloprovincialis TaxID=29158 RepID=A0A8B6BVE3_MYTGA|nr:Hypothetical predicted protein [Mytilus galloprovincialis]